MHSRLACAVAIGMAATLVGGCAVGPDRDQPVKDPQAVATTTSPAVAVSSGTNPAVGNGHNTIAAEHADLVGEISQVPDLAAPYISVGDDLYPPGREGIAPLSPTTNPPTTVEPSHNASKPTQPVTTQESARDHTITNQVMLGLSQNPNLSRDAKLIHVLTNQGVVVLTGTLSKDADRQAIISLIERISGVVRVEDHLRIQ